MSLELTKSQGFSGGAGGLALQHTCEWQTETPEIQRGTQCNTHFLLFHITALGPVYPKLSMLPTV